MGYRHVYYVHVLELHVALLIFGYQVHVSSKTQHGMVCKAWHGKARHWDYWTRVPRERWGKDSGLTVVPL